MGSCVSLSISDQWMNKVCDWIDVKRGYIHNLEKNVTTLETSMGELKAKRDDLLRKVKREEDSGLQRLAEVQVWFTNAETIENRVNDLLSARNVEFQRLCLCGFCSKSLISSYRYGKSVFLALREVEKLKDSGDFNMIAEEAQTPEVEERPLQPIIVGQKEMLEKAWKHLLKDGVGIMGLYELNVKKIVDEIAQKVRLRGEESEKRIDLYNFLRKKRFVLLLDDIWEKVDLAEIGVPFPTKENRCKLAFTTRSQDVCASMGVEDPMEVQCLVENEAFDLFEKKVGKKTLGSDPEIPDLAKKVAKKCRGLPLALNVIGETMSSKRTMEEWCNAVDVLNSYAIEFSGMEDQILPILKYSYDNLKDEHVKSCLLYCAIFPVDNIIRKKKLIDYWIGEGIIDVSGGLERGENKGYEIIGTLFRSSLLLEDVDVVCMHDVVREMALWIASDLGKQKEVFIVHAGVESHKMPKVKNWKVVKKMSLMQTKIDHLAGSPKCLELTTLLLQEGKVGNMSEFFNSMPKLVVLDLSKNPNLFELPEGISELVSLQYLNLSFTPIRLLPMGLRKLKKLIHLSLKGTSMLSSIDGISNLENLIVLKLDDYFAWDPKTVKELEILEHLEALNIGVSHLPFLEQYLSSFMLTSCTRLLEIRGIQLKSTGLSLPVTMEKLRVFRILRCSISEIKMVSLVQNPRNPCFSSLSNVSLQKCKFLRELTLLMFTPNLKDLDVSDSWKLEDIINKKKAYEGERSKKNRCRRIVPFQKLIYLRLANLPKLKNIYWRPLPFPRLKRINVDGCPNLKKLPLGSNSNMHGLIIRYTKKEWIEGVEWQDEATKTCFLPSCEQV